MQLSNSPRGRRCLHDLHMRVLGTFRQSIDIAYRWIDNPRLHCYRDFCLRSRVVGLRPGQERHIEPLVDWYREHGARPTFDWCRACTIALGRADPAQVFNRGSGADRAARVSNFRRKHGHRALIAPMRWKPLDAPVAGWGIAEKTGSVQVNIPVARSIGLVATSHEWKPPGRRGGSSLYDRVGYLADAATAPAFRGRGLASSAEAAIPCCRPGSSSDEERGVRNMERAGLRLHFIRAKWTPI
jgi:ribosomal protein S18 acetylase RimI-like enzyme